jgi:hypothetical protein
MNFTPFSLYRDYPIYQMKSKSTFLGYVLILMKEAPRPGLEPGTWRFRARFQLQGIMVYLIL